LSPQSVQVRAERFPRRCIDDGLETEEPQSGPSNSLRPGLDELPTRRDANREEVRDVVPRKTEQKKKGRRWRWRWDGRLPLVGGGFRRRRRALLSGRHRRRRSPVVVVVAMVPCNHHRRRKRPVGVPEEEEVLPVGSRLLRLPTHGTRVRLLYPTTTTAAEEADIAPYGSDERRSPGIAAALAGASTGCFRDAPLVAPAHQRPLLIYSYNVGWNMDAATRFHREAASRGAIVASLEHTDGTASPSTTRSDGSEARFAPDRMTERLRLALRARELLEAVEVLLDEAREEYLGCGRGDDPGPVVVLGRHGLGGGGVRRHDRQRRPGRFGLRAAPPRSDVHPESFGDDLLWYLLAIRGPDPAEVHRQLADSAVSFLRTMDVGDPGVSSRSLLETYCYAGILRYFFLWCLMYEKFSSSEQFSST